MSNFKAKFRAKWFILPVLTSGFLSIVLFQNCAQQNLVAPSSAPSYSSGVQKLNFDSNTSISPTYCFEGSVKCYKKIYSPDVSDSLTSTTACTDVLDHQICYDLDTYTYDTREALATCTDCDSQAALTNGRYNRIESTCWLQVGNSENPAFYSIKSDLTEALSETLNLCQMSLLSKGEQ